MLLFSKDEAISPEKRWCLSHRRVIPRLLGLIQNQLKYMASLFTDSKEVWIRPKHQSQHHKLCLEANIQPSTNSSALVSCAYSKVLAYSARCLPSASAPHFPGDLAPFAALQLSSLQVTKTWETAPRPTAVKRITALTTRQRLGGGGFEKDKTQQAKKVPVHKEQGLWALGQLC